MKHKLRRMSLIEYGLVTIFWGLIVLHLYRTIAFKIIPGCSLTQSNWIFWSIWVLWILTAVFLTPRRFRTHLSVFAFINAPVAIYMVLSYYTLFRTAYTVILSVTGAVSVAYIVLVFVINRKDLLSGKYRGKLIEFFAHFLHKNRMIISGGLAVIFLVFYLTYFFGLPLMESFTVPTDPKVNTQKIADNIDTLILLQEQEWAALSAQQRLDVLQTVANIEATYLGLPHELNVIVNVLEGLTLGQYNDNTHTITIDADHLTNSDARDLVNTVAHEAYHAYERRLVDVYNNVGAQERNLLLFGRIEEYKNNFDHYIDGNDDLNKYAAQAVECDSVSYAHRAVQDYFEAIDAYLDLDG